jgi:thiamine biosynthesis lipoprotein ApbE
MEIDEGGMGLACTSPSKRKWVTEASGSKHHLVDPRTKQPADKMMAVYTQVSDPRCGAKNCSLADAYSTVLFVMGYDVARKKLIELPVEAMLIDVSGAIYRTDGFKGELFTQKKEAP